MCYSLTNPAWEQSCSMRTERRTNMTKIIVAFCNFANAPKNGLGETKKLSRYLLTVGFSAGSCSIGYSSQPSKARWLLYIPRTVALRSCTFCPHCVPTVAVSSVRYAGCSRSDLPRLYPRSMTAVLHLRVQLVVSRQWQWGDAEVVLSLHPFGTDF
jgi:hypothetical protein